MNDLDRFVVPVTPDLDAKSAGRWVKNVNLLLKTNLLFGLHLDMQTALKIFVDLAGDMAPIQSSLLYLIDEEDGSFSLAVTKGFGDPLPLSLHRGNPVARGTVEKHAPLRLDDPALPEMAEFFRLTGCPLLLSLPVTVRSEARGVLQLFSRDPHAFPDEMVRLLWILALQVGGLLARVSGEASTWMGDTDSFTGLMKRASFEKEVDRELSRARRGDRPFSLLLTGIDPPRGDSDGLTTLQADVLVRGISHLMRKAGRRMDVLCRFSETSVALLLPEVDEARATLLAARLSAMVDSGGLAAIPERPHARVVVSHGVASFPAFGTVADLVGASERALAAARQEGGGRVTASSTLLREKASPPVSLGLSELLGSVGGHFRLQGMIGNLVEFYSRATGAERVSIQSYDPADSSLSFLEGRGFAGFEGDVRRGRSTLEGSISGKSILSKRPLVVEDIDRALPARQRHKLMYKGGSFMTIPLFHHGTPVGVINFSNPKGGKPFTREDLDRIGRHVPLLAEMLAVGKRFEEIQESFFRKTAEILLGVAESKTPYLMGHGERVARTTSQLAAGLGLAPEEALRLTESARYHDLGRIAVDEAVLSKGSTLNPSEVALVHQHPDWSSRILEAIPGLHLDWPAIRSHHERVDGKGYPSGLLGEEIPLGGRILAVADAYDAMTHARPYRKALGPEEAFRVLEEGKGTHWDGRVVAALKTLSTLH